LLERAELLPFSAGSLNCLDPGLRFDLPLPPLLSSSIVRLISLAPAI
jgi:hypothetical protein